MVVEASEISAMKDVNVVLLNESTDDVSCEIQCNKNLSLYYILGKNKYMSLPNTNQNLKNCRGQMVSVPSAS